MYKDYADQPAYPIQSDTPHWSGISVRNYFAALAMQSLIQKIDVNFDATDEDELESIIFKYQSIASHAQLIASEMIHMHEEHRG